MLKIVPPENFQQQSEYKCGEICCRNLNEFTIYCCFCKTKLFAFEDFIHHLENMHFENQDQNVDTIIEECYNNESENEEETMDSVWVENVEPDDLVEECADDYVCMDEENVEEECLNIVKEEIIDEMENEEKEPNVDIESTEEEEDFTIVTAPQKIIKDEEIEINTDIECDAESDDDYEPKVTEYNSECSVESSNNSQVENKKSKNNNKLLEYPCPECSETFKLKLLLDDHIVDVHGGHKCSVCGKRFGLRHHMVRHVSTHNTERKYVCPIAGCGKAFVIQEYVKRHLEYHNLDGNSNRPRYNIKKFVCDMCGYNCSALVTLQIHQRIHTGEKPYKCENCGNCYVSKYALKHHMLTHSTVRDRVCNICQATFKSNSILKRHMYIHSDERRFKCRICDKGFKQPHCRDAHVRYVHKKEEPVKRIRKKVNKSKPPATEKEQND